MTSCASPQKRMGKDMRGISLNRWSFRIAFSLLCLGLLSSCGLFGGKGSLDAGARYQAEGKYRAAYIEAKKVLQQNDKNGAAWLLLGKASMMLGDPTSAMNDLQNAQSNGVPEKQTMVPMGQLLRVTGQYEKLLKTVSPEKLTDLDAKGRAYVLLGDAYFGLKNYDKAKQSFQSALLVDTKDPRALAGLARLSAINGDTDTAGNYVHEALAAAPENPQAWMVKADLAFNSKDFAGAESDYQKLLGFEKPDWLPQDRLFAMMRLANAQAQQKQYDQALATLDKVEKMAPSQPYPHYLHAVVLYMQGKLADSMSQLQQVLKVQPDNAQAQFMMGAVNYAQGNYAQAQMFLSNVMGMDQKNAHARELLALTLYRSGHKRQAVNALRQAVPGNSSDAELLAMLEKAVAHGVGNPDSKGSEAGGNTSIESMIAKTNKAFASGNDSETIRMLKAMPAGDAATEARRNIMLVMAYLRDKQVDQAVGTAAAFVANYPKESGAHLLYATALDTAGNRKKARAEYSEAYKLDPKNLSALLGLGNLDVLAGHYKDASSRFEAVLKKDPKNSQAMNGLGRLAMLQDKKADGIKRFKQAITAAPDSADAYISLLVIYSQDGNYKEALNTAKKLANARPDDPLALNALGAAELNAGNHDKALKPLLKAVSLAPKDPLYRTNLARAQILSKDSKNAQDNLQQVVSAYPGQISAATMLAYMKLQDHDLPGAVALAQALQKHDPHNVAGFRLEGDLYMASKSWNKAAQAYQEGLKVNSERALVIKAYQALSRTTGMTPEHVLRGWLSKHPDDTAIRLMLGQYYDDHGKKNQAADQYRKVLKSDPANVNALNNLAWVYTENHDSRGIALAEKAHKLAPQSPYIADTYGWALISRNQYKRALPILEKAAAEAPKIPTIQYHLALAQAHTGNKNGARATLEALQKSAVEYPEKPAAEKLYRELIKETGRSSGK